MLVRENTISKTRGMYRDASSRERNLDQAERGSPGCSVDSGRPQCEYWLRYKLEVPAERHKSGADRVLHRARGRARGGSG